MAVERPAPAPPPAPARGRRAVWLGAAVTVLVLGALIWRFAPLTPGPAPTPTPGVPTARPTAVLQDTPTPLAGAATFTPVPGAAGAGPQVLGITAGVGMRAGDVAGAASIAVTFSEAMDPASAQAAFALQPAVAGTFHWQQTTLLFEPSAPLAPATVYTASIATTARTASGQPIVAPLSAGFQTAPPPTILRTLPSAGASEVPTDTIVTITFNRPMIPLTALDSQPDPSAWVSISPAVVGRWVWLGTAAAGFHASNGFLPATAYHLAVKAGWPDATGVTLAAGTTADFTTIRPAILSATPGNGAANVPLDTALRVRFNMAMEHGSVQRAIHLGGAAAAGAYAWSPDSTVVTFTPGSLLDFSHRYDVTLDGPVQAAAGGVPGALAGSANSWTFQTTDATHVDSHHPMSSPDSPAQPSEGFGFAFNNPLAPDQDVAHYLTVDPVPQGYQGRLLESGATAVYTDNVQLLADTTYHFALAAGLKDKWGFPVAPDSWDVTIGPLPPSLTLDGGTFQPIYSQGPSRVQIETANLDHVSLHLYRLSEDDVRMLLSGNGVRYNPNGTPTYPGTLTREWDVPVTPGAGGTATVFPALGLDAKADRLPAGYYYLRVTAPTPYGNGPLEATSVLLVGRTGLVMKNEGKDLLVWAADLHTGQPVPGYRLRVETATGDRGFSTQQHGRTGADGVWRTTLGDTSYDQLAVWGEEPGDSALLSAGWSANMLPGGYGESPAATRAALYTDRPIYRPGQTVYFRGVYRADDDANYSVPPAGTTVSLTAQTYGPQGQTSVFTGTAKLSAAGTFSGQFVLPATAPVGNYSLTSDSASASFAVQEYRKPDFQVDVTPGQPEVIHGDPVTATIQTSYYFGGPLAAVTTTVNLQSSPYSFSWSDPDTGETYVFGEGGLPWILDTYAYSGGPYRPQPPAPVQSFQALTDQDGRLVVDVTKYVTTTDTSKSLLIEGQVQDLSNQAVAANTSVVVHQGLYYVGLRVGDYIATAKQPTTMTVRTVAPAASAPNGGRVQANTVVHLRVVREEWAPPARGATTWTQREVPVDSADVTTDATGRATYRFTPPQGGSYRLIGESTDARGNLIHSSTAFWAASSDPGYIPWQFDNPQQVKLVADKPSYQVGDTAHILVTSPFTEATALLTVERGHLRRYQILTLHGGAPTIDVPLEAGDVPNVYIGLTLLGPGAAPAGAPADWGNQVSLRQGYLDVPLSTAGKALHVSVAPQGAGPYAPGSTAQVRVQTTDSAGRPVAAELSLAVVDEAIFALAGDTSADLFDTFWSERGLGVRTASSFTAGDNGYYGYRGDLRLAGGAGAPAGAAAPAPTAAQENAASTAAPAAPATVRTNFQDTAFWDGAVTTGSDGTAVVPVPLPDNLTTWRITTQGITGATLAGQASAPLTVTQALLLRPVQPRFLITGDNPHPQAIIHNNTDKPLQVVASLVVSGALTLDKSPAAEQTLTVDAGKQAVVTWSVQVGAGDAANLRYWVHTANVAQGAPGYLEDAVGAQIPVEPFAAPETVATSGEVSGTRADESILLPFSVKPLLGELVVQVSPSLAAATTDSLKYVQEYPYESTDQTVSRFLPLVVLEQVYEQQGLRTPYAGQIPGLVDHAFSRLAELQQPDGGWGWWELGPSSWWETAYAVQGLTAARDAGYAVPGAMLQRGIARLQAYAADNNTAGLDATYHLNMRAYTLYVLGGAVGGGSGDLTQQARDLAGQAPRLSNHARAWLALALARLGAKDAAQQVLASLAAAARQSSTTAHWEESAPDYWSMGTDNRATALAIDALVTIDPSDPLIPKAVRWLMNAEKDGHWLSTQETAISLISLAHYIQQSQELTADYTWQLSLADKLLGQGAASRYSLTQTTTLRVPVSQIPQNTLTDLSLARSTATGKLYYQASLRYYVPGEGIQARSEGLAIARTYFAMPGGGAGDAGTTPISSAAAGDLIRVRLTIVSTETRYYVQVTDPLPAGLEGVNGSLNTTSFTERPPNPSGTRVGPDQPGGFFPWLWRWGPFDNVEMRDDRTVLFAGYLGPGTYVYDYFARATTPGVYLTLPARAELVYYPDVFGYSDGGTFTVR